MSEVYIGTSGFYYGHWRGVFYPQDLPQSKWFEYYCQHFDTVELNVSFYRLPKKETFEKWRRIAFISGQSRAHLRGKRRCRSFVFAVKGSRYITHVKRLKDCQEAVRRFFEAAKGLRNVGGKREVRTESGGGDEKWGKKKTKHLPSFLTSRPASHISPQPPDIILWQLPPRFKVNFERLREFLRILPFHLPGVLQAQHHLEGVGWRYAFEFRDESWLDKRVFRVLRDFGAAVVFQDYPDWPITEEITADFVYLRFHGRQTLYSSCYTEKDLERWAKKIRGWVKRDLDVYAYFNNDALGYAVENAKTLRRLASHA